MGRSFAKRSIVVVAAISLALSLAACTPAPSSDSKEPGGGGSQESALAVVWSSTADCAGCHTAEAESMVDGTTVHSVHVKNAALGSCDSCHDDEGALSQAHANYQDEGVRMPRKLKSTEVSDAKCTDAGCHDVQELIAETASVAVLTDLEGTVKNPHEMTVDELHKVGGSAEADLVCVDCHSMHAAGGANPSSVSEAAVQKCKNCHHAEVYACGTCHE